MHTKTQEGKNKRASKAFGCIHSASTKILRNPLPKVKIDSKILPEKYKSFIEAGIVKNQAELAKKLKFSRAIAL